MSPRTSVVCLALLAWGCSEKKKVAQAQAEVESLQRELDSKAPYMMGTPAWAECPDESTLSKHVDPWGRQYWIESQLTETPDGGAMFVSYRCIVACDGPDRVGVTDDIRAPGLPAGSR